MLNSVLKIIGVLFLLVLVVSTYIILGNSGSTISIFIIKKNPYQKSFGIYSKLFKDNTIVEFTQVQKVLYPVSSKLEKIVNFVDNIKWTLVVKVYSFR